MKALTQLSLSSSLKFQSAIDNIILSPLMSPEAGPLQTSDMPTGHKALQTVLQGYEYVEDEYVYDAPPKLEWMSKATMDMIPLDLQERFHEACTCGSLDNAWLLWNSMAKALCKTKKWAGRGDIPRFRKTDQMKAKASQSLMAVKWKHASPEDRGYLAQQWMETKAKWMRSRMARWRKEMANSLQQDTREFFHWLRGPRRQPSRSLRDGNIVCCTKAQCLQALARFWIAITGKRDSFLQQRCVFLDHDDEIEVIESLRTVKAIIRSVKSWSSVGYDGWKADEWKEMPSCLIMLLEELFQSSRRYQATPQAWLSVRIAFIPKTGLASPTVDQYRPISIAPLVYRTYAKWLLATLPDDVYDTFPAACVGGLKGREAVAAWYETALQYEEAVLQGNTQGPPLYGIAIDTYKFFDFIDLEKAAQMLIHLKVPRSTVMTWHHWAQHHRRFLSFAGLTIPESYCVTRGIPQGCPLSMLAANGLMTHWAESIPRGPVTIRAFVDDRLLSSNDFEALQAAVWKTESFDATQGMYAKEKTIAWSSHKTHRRLTWKDGDEIKEGVAPYLGLPLVTKRWSAQSWYQPVIKKIYETAVRAGFAKVNGEKGDKIVTCKLLPMLVHATVLLRPSSSQIAKLRSIFRMVTWKKRPWASWHLIQIILKGMKQDPQVAGMLHAWTTFQRHLQTGAAGAIEQWQTSWTSVQGTTIPTRFQGPVSNLNRDLELWECDINGDSYTKIVDSITGNQVDLLKQSTHDLRKFIKARMMRVFTKEIAKRQHLVGIEDIDIDTTSFLCNKMKKEDPLRGPLITVLTDALPTPRRRYRAGLASTDHCDLCGSEGADQRHVLWTCPFGAELRKDWPIQDPEQLPGCGRTAAICTISTPEKYKKVWMKLQLGIATLIHQWQCTRREMRLQQDALRPGWVKPDPSQKEVCQEKGCLALQARQMRCYRQMRWRPPVTSKDKKYWSMEIDTFNQLWRYWLGCHATTATRCTSWLERWADYFVKNGCHPICDQWQSEGSIRRQVWRFRQASEKLLYLCEDTTEKNTNESEILVHPGLPHLMSSGYKDALWHPERVAKIMDYLIEEHDAISMNRGSTMTWMQLREHLPQNWISTPLESTTPTTAIFGIIRSKQKPHMATGDLDEQMLVTQVKTEDPAECPFEELSMMTLAEFTRAEVKRPSDASSTCEHVGRLSRLCSRIPMDTLLLLCGKPLA